MKTLFLFAFLLLVNNICSGQHDIASEQNNDVPCTGPEFFTDEDYFRAFRMEINRSQAIAERMAHANAMQNLAKHATEVINIALQNYFSAKEAIFNDLLFTDRAELYDESGKLVLLRECSSMRIRGPEIICSEDIQKEDGMFYSYVVIQAPVNHIVQNTAEILEEDYQITDFDTTEFKNVLTDIIREMRREQGY